MHPFFSATKWEGTIWSCKIQWTKLPTFEIHGTRGISFSESFKSQKIEVFFDFLVFMSTRHISNFNFIKLKRLILIQVRKVFIPMTIDLKMLSFCKIESIYICSTRKKARKSKKYFDLLAVKQILIYSVPFSTVNAMNFWRWKVLSEFCNSVCSRKIIGEPVGDFDLLKTLFLQVI